MENLDAKAQLMTAQMQESLPWALPPNFWQTILQLLQTILPLLGPLCGLTSPASVKDRAVKPRLFDVLRLAMLIRQKTTDAFLSCHARETANAMTQVAAESTLEELSAILSATH